MEHRAKKRIKRIVLILILLILLAVMVYLGLEIMGKKSMHAQVIEEIPVTAPLEEAEVEDDGMTVTYKGEKYRYNENITSILCMGVDKREVETEDVLIGTAGQADMLMLAIMDTQSGVVKLWNISRDSMTDVDIYNVDGQYVRTEKLQACLAYAYGDGKKGSCENTVKAVSRLLYGMPIQSYAVLDLDAIRPLNDAIGGVEVTIHEGDILPGRFVPGTTVLLKGNDVEPYVRSRRTEIPGEPIDSNNNRMARQRQYMMKFIQKALQMTKEDLTTPMRLFKVAMEEDYMVTNLDISKVAYLSKYLGKISFSEGNFQTVPGEVVAGAEHAEYHVDDEKLYEMILETFYVKE